MDISKYQLALDEDPSDPSALRALGEEAAAEGNRQEMMDYLTREADLCEQPREKADLLVCAGRVRREKLNDAEGALRNFQDALEAYPLSRAAREEEWRLLIDLNRWADLASSLSAEAQTLAERNPRHAQALHLIRADVQKYRMNDPDGAEKACRQAIELNGKRLAHVPLMEIQARQGRWEELETTFKALEDSAASFEEKAAFGYLRALLLEGRLGKPEDAEALLSELVESSPGDPSTLWHATAMLAISELAFTRGDEVGFVNALSKLTAFIEAESGPASARWRAALLHRQGDTVQSAKDDDEAALEKYRKAHELSPADPRHLRAMIRLESATGSEGLLASLKTLSKIESGPKLSSAFELFLGRTLDIGSGRIEEALQAFRKARKPNPSLHLAEIEADALRRLGRWSELDELLSEQADATEDEGLKAALLSERGQILLCHLNRPEDAAKVFRQALEMPATSLGLARNAARAYADMGDNENLARALIEQKQIVGDPAYLAHLEIRAADLWLRLGRGDEAFKALSSVIQTEGENIEALLMLEQINYAQKSLQELYDSQERILGLLDHEDDVDYANAVWLDQAALLLGGLNNEQWALVILRQILESNPADPAALIELRHLAYRGERWDEYFETAIREVESLGRNPSLLWRAAQAAWTRLDRITDALDMLGEIVDKGSSTVILLETIKMLQFLTESWAPWLSTAESLAPLLDDSGRVLIYFEMARAHRWRRKSLDSASEYYGRMVQIEPDCYEAHESLCMINLEKRDFENQRKVLARLADLEQDPAMRAAYRFRRADLAELAGALDDAEEDLKAVIESTPDDLAALRRLERLYSIQNPKAQIDILGREIKLRREPRMLALLLLRRAVLWEGLHNYEEAAACYREVLSHNPGELESIEALTRLYRQEGEWRELRENLERQVSVTTDTKLKVELLTQAAEICEEKIGDPISAIAGHVAALEIDPNLLHSLGKLESLYEATESWEEELAILKRLLDIATDPDQQHRIHFKMGRIYEEKMAEPSEAVSSLLKAHEIKSDHLETIEALEQLYDQGDDAARLAPLLEKKAALLPEERVRLYIWIGKLWDEKLSDPIKAIKSYERVLKIDPANLEALDSIESVFERAGQWEDVIRTVTAKAEAVKEPIKSAEFYCRAGALWTDKLQNDEQALAAYSKAISIDPLHGPSLAGCRDIYARLGLWEEVVSVYSHEMQVTEDLEAKADICARMGEILENRINNQALASLQYEMALRCVPDHLDAVQALGRIYFDHQYWDDADTLYRKWVKLLGDHDPPEEVARVYYQRGRVLQGLSRDREALVYYRRSIEKKPDYLEPHRARSDLYGQRHVWEEALEAEAKVLAILEKQGDLAGVGESLGKMGGFAQKAGRTEEAINHYTRLLEIQGEQAPTIENLIGLYSDRNLWNDVKDLYDRLIAIHQGAPEQAEIRLRKGIMLEEKIGENLEALEEYNRALEERPDYSEALYRRAGALIKLGMWDEAEDSAERLLKIEKEPCKLADAHCLLGRIEQEGRKDVTAAREAYETALGIEPAHLGAMDAIGMILEAIEGWTGYVRIIDKFLQNVPPSEIECIHDIHLRLGKVQRDKLENRDRAVMEFNNAVKAKPDSIPAHRALAKLHLEDKSSYPQAIRENRLLIKANPLFEEAYHDLAKIYEEQRESDREFCIHAILHFFGALEKKDTTNYEARLKHLPAHPDKHLDDEMRECALIHPMARLPATAIFGSLGGQLCKILPAGDSPYARLPEKHPARRLAAELAKKLRLKAYDIYQGEDNGPGVSWFSGNTPAFVLNTAVFDSTGPRGQRFLVARGLEGVKNGLASFHSLGKAETLKRLQVVVKLFKPEVTVTGMNKKEARSLAKSLNKKVPRKVRKFLQVAANSHHSQGNQFSFENWRTGLVHSANRGGLVISGHPGEASKALLLLEGKIKSGESPTPQVMKTSEQLAELLSFVVSDQYFLARKRVGLFVG
jgi:tetratricopeptide (TPR) repeat protein